MEDLNNQSLESFLQEISGIKDVISIMSIREKTSHYDIKSYGLGSLLNKTEKCLEEIAKIAIANSIKVKVDRSYAWCRDGFAKSLALGLSPFPYGKIIFQVRMLANISKIFGYKFEQSFLTSLTTISLIGFNQLLEPAFTNFSGINSEYVTTIHDVLSQLISKLNEMKNVLPFKEQLIDLLQSFDHLNLISGLTVLKYITAITTAIATGLLGFLWIETLKEYKKAEYEGEPSRELEEIFKTKLQNAQEFIQLWILEPSLG